MGPTSLLLPLWFFDSDRFVTLRHASGSELDIHVAAVGAHVSAYVTAGDVYAFGREMLTFSATRFGRDAFYTADPHRRSEINDQYLVEYVQERAEKSLASLLIWLLHLGNDLDHFGMQLLDGMSARDWLRWCSRNPELHYWRVDDKSLTPS